MTDQIKREISIMKQVRHTNIVQLLEVMASKEKIYFVMEYVKGGTLCNKLIAKGKLREDLARKYFQQLVNAVDFCHCRGVYHRDLKPENILLDECGDLKVSDFGLSAVSEQLKEDGLLHTTCGSPAYVAPEVIMRKGYEATALAALKRIQRLLQRNQHCFNAFDIISLSRGFDLSGLFEEKEKFKDEIRFTSMQPASMIIAKLEEIAKNLRFNVRKIDCKVKLQGPNEGRK
ncbi:hypothetical protein KI387_041341, partial [Taxus chinensis]